LDRIQHIIYQVRAGQAMIANKLKINNK
jgi:hypothetical protein